jgi:hypothetical protein
LPNADADGLVDLIVFAPSEAAITPYSFTRRDVDAGSGRYLLLAPDAPAPTGQAGLMADGDTVDAESVDLGAPAGSNVSDPNGAAVASIVSEAGTADNTTAGQYVEKYPCGAVRVTGFHPTRKDVVGQWFSTTAGVHADFAYTNGASSSLGVGWSASGTYGSWHQSGTSSKDSTATIGFPEADGVGGHYYLTKWTLKKIHVGCAGVPDSWHYEVFTKSFAGGAWVVDGVPAPSGNWKCLPYPDGSQLTKDDTTAVTWTNGFDISNVLGIDLSTRTGYSTRASIHISVTKDAGVNLCGLGDYAAGDHPYVIKAKP